MAKKERRLSFCFLLLLCHLYLINALYAFERKEKYPEYYFSFSYYTGNIGVGDINSCLNSFNNNDLFKYIRENNPSWGEIEGEIQPLLGRYKALGLGLYIDLNPKLSLAVSTCTPIRQNNSSSLTYYYHGSVGTQVMTYYFEPSYKLLFPIEFVFYYNLARIDKLKLAIGVGSGLYYAKLSRIYIREIIPPLGGLIRATINFDTKRLPLPDLVGNLNILTEYYIGRGIYLNGEISLRSGKISNFKGSGSLLHEINSEIWANDKWKGTLYFFSMEDPEIGVRYNNMEVWSYIPDASIYFLENIRRASLNLTGLSLKIGLKIKLF